MKKQLWIALAALVIIPFTMKPLFSYAEDRYADLQNFSKVLNLIQQYYVEEVDTKKLVYGAIKGMLRELDPHTNFMPPDIYKDFESETSGEFGGLGIEISVTNGVLTIISPIEDTPAWHAGIKAGDKVIAVDGKSTKGVSLVEASQMMRGKRGTKIVLKIVRDGQEGPLDITIVRGQVKIRSVKYTDMEDGFAYFRVTSFIENTAKDLEAAIEKHKEKHKKIEGILIDLRRNPGGLLDQAVKVSDMFLKDGTIVSTIGRDKKQKEVTVATKKGKYTEIPMIVLINEYSASASEIVSGALQDNKRALIVGNRSFGKGSVQSVIKLGDGSGLKLTVARYYTPSGISIQAEGIKPDIEIEDLDLDTFMKAINKSKALREKDMQGHLRGDREKESDLPDLKEGAPAFAWWKEIGSKKEEQLTAKEKLFRNDYQAYQAFGYLRAMKSFRQIK